MTELEVVKNMFNRNEKNVIIDYEDNYISKKGYDYDRVAKLGVQISDNYLTLLVFDCSDESFIEVIDEKVSTDEYDFKKLLESADVDYEVSSGKIDMLGEISETDDIEIQQNGSAFCMKFLFGKSSQSFLGTVTEVKDKPKFTPLH